MKMPSTRKALRCAIYTRVSTDQGLEQDFNSLDAQREACGAYIKSQAHEGWKALPAVYDDGGFSGGSMERPALQKLIEDIKARKVDIVVVYKVDRLTRSLADFAKLVELFDVHGVSFVSVTQSFNTTTSMGRLTLNVLLSFAQFEREVTGERIRDKIAASKKKGLWVGGIVPLGYRVEGKRLVIDREEAATVRLIFERYLELGSLPALQRDLREKGVISRVRTLSSGRTIGGIALTNGPLAHILKNRVYLGEINHQGASYRGEHEPIIDAGQFDDVKGKIADNTRQRREKQSASEYLLTGRIYDDRGNRMSPSYAIKKGGIRYRYYTSTALAQGQKDRSGSVGRVAALDVEQLVIAKLRGLGASGDISDSTEEVERAHDSARQTGNIGERQLVERVLDRVVLRKSEIVITLRADAKASNEESERIVIPWIPTLATRKRDLISPTAAPGQSRKTLDAEARNRLLIGIAQSRTWLDELITNPSVTIAVIAKREGTTDRSIRSTFNLAFLSPDIVKAAVEGRLPIGMGLMRLSDMPSDWGEQRRDVGLW